MDAYSLSHEIEEKLEIDASRFVYFEMVEIVDIIKEAETLLNDKSPPGTFDDHEDTRCFTVYYLNVCIVDPTQYPKETLKRLKALDEELANLF